MTLEELTQAAQVKLLRMLTSEEEAILAQMHRLDVPLDRILEMIEAPAPEDEPEELAYVAAGERTIQIVKQPPQRTVSSPGRARG